MHFWGTELVIFSIYWRCSLYQIRWTDQYIESTNPKDMFKKMGPTPFMTDYCEHRVPYQLSVRYVSRRRMLSRRAGTLRHHMIESHNLIDKYDFQINFLELKYRGLLHAAGFCARFSQSDLQCQTQYHLEKRGLREGWYFAFYLGIWRSLSLAHAFLLGRDLGICPLVSELMLFSSSEVPLHNTLLPMR